MTVFLDTNIIVQAFTNNVHQANCRKALSTFFLTDTLALVEAYQALERITKDRSYVTIAIKSLLSKDCIIIPLHNDVLFDSLRKAHKYNLSIFDLIHYINAKINNCSTIASYDKHFDNLEIKRVEP
tara:strand:+ start:6626 stop:7003 length:378 start_codon:yes stop_codon:yes gene_type:complete